LYQYYIIKITHPFVFAHNADLRRANKTIIQNNLRKTIIAKKGRKNEKKITHPFVFAHNADLRRAKWGELVPQDFDIYCMKSKLFTWV